jgi:phosphoribosylpyrophosphate synthetase
MNKMHDLEDKIMSCWNVVDDIKICLESSDPENDKIMNLLIGISELYSIKFEKLWDTYESALVEYYDK